MILGRHWFVWNFIGVFLPLKIQNSPKSQKVKNSNFYFVLCISSIIHIIYFLKLLYFHNFIYLYISIFLCFYIFIYLYNIPVRKMSALRTLPHEMCFLYTCEEVVWCDLRKPSRGRCARRARPQWPGCAIYSGSRTSREWTPACYSEKHPELRTVAYCVRRPSARGSEPRLHEPVVQAERVHRDRVERFGLGHERVANKRDHSTAKKRSTQHCGVLCGVPQYTRPRNSAGTMPCAVRARSAWPGWEIWSRSRMGREWITIHSEAPARGSHAQFWRSTVELAMGPFEISAGGRGCTFSESGEWPQALSELIGQARIIRRFNSDQVINVTPKNLVYLN